MNGFLVLNRGYPITCGSGIAVWPTEAEAQAWIDALRTKKARERCYVLPLVPYDPEEML